MPENTDKIYWRKFADGKFGKFPKGQQIALEMLATIDRKTPCKICGTPKPPGIKLCADCMSHQIFCFQENPPKY